MKHVRTFAALAALGLVAAAGAAVSVNDDIQREGAGERRDALTEMELKPFDPALWAHLSDWSNGTGFNADNTKGKVVLIATWSSWYKTSHSPLAAVEKLAQANTEDLIVIGVHHQNKFEDAKATAEKLGLTFPYAHDKNGAFREALKVDMDPDFYVIDRAGNLRYADIMTSAVERAVKTLVSETAEEAAALPGKLAETAAKAEKDAWKSTGIKGDQKPGEILDVDFTMPDAALFEAAKWPEFNTNNLSAQDFQGKSLPASFGNEQYLTKKPKTDGRVVVIDFWATWCGPCKAAIPKLEEMQKAHRQDLVILGISDEPRGTVERFLAGKKHSYAYAIDEKKTLNGAFNVRGIPHVVVLSSDGTVRWQGNPHQGEFAKAVKAVIEADPGVKARRAAEQAYLAKQGG